MSAYLSATTRSSARSGGYDGLTFPTRMMSLESGSTTKPERRVMPQSVKACWEPPDLRVCSRTLSDIALPWAHCTGAADRSNKTATKTNPCPAVSFFIVCCRLRQLVISQQLTVGSQAEGFMRDSQETLLLGGWLRRLRHRLSQRRFALLPKQRDKRNPTTMLCRIRKSSGMVGVRIRKS